MKPIRDLEAAICLIENIINPNTEPITGLDPRQVYISEAQKLLKRDLKDKTARDLLQATVEVYSR